MCLVLLTIKFNVLLSQHDEHMGERSIFINSVLGNQRVLDIKTNLNLLTQALV